MTDKRDKHRTQAIPEDGRKGRPDAAGIPKDERGAGGGGPIGPKDEGKPFRGGQSHAAYHGHGQLGERAVENEENANAPRKG